MVNQISRKRGKKTVPFSDSSCDYLNMTAGSDGKGGKKELGRTQSSDCVLGGRHIIPWVVVYAD